MAKGATAKIEVENIIKNAFGNNFIGVVDKKLYVWADDGGQKVQIAIALTCPKVEVEVGAAAPVLQNGGWDFDAAAQPTVTIASNPGPVEITPEEEANIQALLARLGL